MNCTTYTLSGLGTQCLNSIGGIQEVYMGLYTNLYRTEIIDGLITPYYSGDLHKYTFPKNTGSLTSTLTTNDNAASLFENELSLVFGKMDTQKRIEMMALAQSYVFAIVKDSNGKYYFLGEDSPLEMSVGAGETGLAKQDPNKYSCTLSNFSKEFPYELSQSAINQLNIDQRSEYLTFTAISGTAFIGWYQNAEASYTAEIEYSYDGEDWENIALDETPIQISSENELVNKVYLRGLNPYGTLPLTELSENEHYCGFIFDNRSDNNTKVKISGNIMSLVHPTNFARLNNIMEGATFAELFGCDDDGFKGNWYPEKCIYDASQLYIPSGTIPTKCFQHLFYNCVNLKYAPQLLSTTLGSYCYRSMFRGCENLQVTQKELPATTMTEECYAFMYSDCIKLSVAPQINANILANGCFSYMFSGCYELVIAPEINAPTLVSSCCEYMFAETHKLKKITIRSVNGINTTNLEKWLSDGNTSGQIIIDASTTNDWEYDSDSGIPTGWVVIPV